MALEVKITPIKLEIECYKDCCRICMCKETNMKSVFELTRIVEEIQFITGILIKPDAGLPTLVCENCLEKLSVACDFKNTCLQSDEMFQKMLTQKFSPHNIKEEVIDDENNDGEQIEDNNDGHERVTKQDMDMDCGEKRTFDSEDELAEDEQFIELTPTEILDETQNATDSLIPAKSREKYLAAYDSFLQWKTKENTQSFSEKVFTAYFSELANAYKPSSLWCIYSMLRSMVKLKHGVDIKTYSKLMEFLKRRSDGYIGRKSKVLSPADVDKFLKEAPDSQYLATKVALIFGVIGACRRQELYNITTKDVESHGEMLLVKIAQAKTKIPRSFTIHGTFRDIVKKYEALRSKKTKSDRFFQNFQRGKCTAQTIGINKFGNMPKEIAKYLGLPQADLYTGHSFRRTSASMLADSRADLLTLKRIRSRRFETLADSIIEDSIQNKAEISDNITQAVNLEPEAKNNCPEPNPCTSSSMSNLATSSSNLYNLPPTTQENESTKLASINVTQTVQLPSKTIQYRFENCTFTNCFNT